MKANNFKTTDSKTTDSKQKILVIGNGIATTKLITYISQPEKFEVTILSNESVIHYNRVMLSPLLAKEVTFDTIAQSNDNFYYDKNTKVILNQYVTEIQHEEQCVITHDKQVYEYDKLIIATGSSARIPEIDIQSSASLSDLRLPERQRFKIKGIMGFRDMLDVELMQEYADNKASHAVVVGGGLLGIEAAYGLNKLGIDTYLIHRNQVLMNRQIDGTASQLLEGSLVNIGINVIKPDNIKAVSITAERELKSVTLESGEVIPCNLLVYAAGIIPNTKLAKQCGIETDRAIRINAQLQTNLKNIYAIGECSEFDGTTYGLIAPIDEQAKVLAKVLQGELIDGKQPSYEEKEFSTRLKVNGIHMHSMGKVNADDQDEVIELLDVSQNAESVYKKIIINDGRIVGAMLFGDIDSSQWYFDLYQNKESIKDQREILIFGQQFAA